jgi:polyisoprenoid-binding protein YceI
MKKIVLIILFFIAYSSFAQKEIITTKGIINFEASVPLFEEVNATNETVSCTLNIKTGEITSIVLMKDFHFKLSLMEEHFNKKYLETDKYPEATFKGKVQGFNLNIIGNVPKEFKMNGKLEIHGKSKEITTIIFLKKAENGLEISADLKLKTSDFNIEIPEILSVKIAETVNIKSNFLLK